MLQQQKTQRGMREWLTRGGSSGWLLRKTAFFSHVTLLTATSRRRRRYKRLQLASILSFFFISQGLLHKVNVLSRVLHCISISTAVSKKSVSFNRFFFFSFPLCYNYCMRLVDAARAFMDLPSRRRPSPGWSLCFVYLFIFLSSALLFLL